MEAFVEVEPDVWQLVLSLLPVVGLVVFVLLAIALHALSPSHGLNRRHSAPYNYGGGWTDYTKYTEGDHPDFDEPYEVPERKRPTKRKRKRKTR